ncbi:MAG: hypothetical protein AAFO89_02125, partial [Planctomycetota bacterium]
LERSGAGLISRDAEGVLRFDASLTSHDALRERIEVLKDSAAWSDVVASDDGKAAAAYEQTFKHAAFTGRSGTMHKYEGLGSVYWHMVSKLMLAVQETTLRAADAGADPATVSRLVGLYRRVRDGLGFRKTPREFGAVPFEPYSHTPWGRGAQQPGMTGQVKEGVLARAAEVGVRLSVGTIRFDATLLDDAELLTSPSRFPGTDIELPVGSIASTVCGVPVVVSIGDVDEIVVEFADGGREKINGPELPASIAAAVFERRGSVSGVRASVVRA